MSSSVVCSRPLPASSWTSEREGTLVRGVACQEIGWQGRRPADRTVTYRGVARRLCVLFALPIGMRITRDRRCRPCGTCPATNRRDPCHLIVVVVAVVGGRALPPLRSPPRRNRGCGLDGKQSEIATKTAIREIRGTLPQ